jgi:hypothetical protein
MLRGRASHVNSESVYDYLKAIITWEGKRRVGSKEIA